LSSHSSDVLPENYNLSLCQIGGAYGVTCVLQGVTRYIYLVRVLQHIDRHPAGQILELTPRVRKERFAGNLLRSNLDSTA